MNTVISLLTQSLVAARETSDHVPVLDHVIEYRPSTELMAVWALLALPDQRDQPNMNPHMAIRSAIPILASEADHLSVKEALPTVYEFVFGRALGTGTGDKHSISQTVLEWIFVVIALSLLAILVIWRCTCMRYRNQRLRASMLPVSRPPGRRSAAAYHSNPRNLQSLQQAHVHDSEDIANGTTFDRHSRTLVLSPSFLHTGLMPLVDDRGVQINTPSPAQPRTRGQRVSALDIDEGGRRGGGRGDDDDDREGDLGPGDELPAYEVGKRPPGYQTAIGNTARPDIVEVGLPERTDRSMLHLEETPNTDPSHSQAARMHSLQAHEQNSEPSGVSPLPPDTTPQYHPPPPIP